MSQARGGLALGEKRLPGAAQLGSSDPLGGHSEFPALTKSSLGWWVVGRAHYDVFPVDAGAHFRLICRSLQLCTVSYGKVKLVLKHNR